MERRKLLLKIAELFAVEQTTSPFNQIADAIADVAENSATSQVDELIAALKPAGRSLGLS